jgi:hypothetical protein
VAMPLFVAASYFQVIFSGGLGWLM